MPLTKSAIKRVRQDHVRHKRLVPYKTSMKTMMKKLADAMKAGKKDEAVALLPKVYKSIDTAAKKKVIHANTASRKKSLVARLVAAK